MREPAGTNRWCYRRVMPGPRVVSGAVAGALVAAGAAAVARATMQHGRVVAKVRRRLADATYQRLGDIGAVDALRVLPLVDRGVQRPGLRGEPGVSYLIRAGRETLLFDTGLNLFRRSRSALVDNAEALGVDLSQVPALVLSHQHEDHVGGVRAQRAGTFAGTVALSRKTLAKPGEVEAHLTRKPPRRTRTTRSWLWSAKFERRSGGSQTG
jgi:hypothetical protein